jgi:multiple sugar transport system substrate-binding protein
MLGLFFTAEAFEVGGVDYPDVSWTWDDLRDAAAELTIDTEGDGRIDQYGLIAQNDFASGWNWIWQNGGQVINEDRTGSEMSSPETLEARQFFESMMNEDGSIPPPDVISDLGYTTAFTGENAAMGIYGHYLVPRLEDEAPFEWGTTLLPEGPVNRNSFASGAGFTMSSQTDHPDEAWALISHLAGVDGLRAFMELGSTPPSRASLYDSETFLEREASRAFADQAEHLTPLPIAPEWNEYFDIITSELDAAYRGQQSVDEAAANIDDRVADVLSD